MSTRITINSINEKVDRLAALVEAIANTKTEAVTAVNRAEAEVEAAKERVQTARKSARKAPKRKTKRVPAEDRPFAPLTKGISMALNPKSATWAEDYAFLRFHGEDNEPHPIGCRLDPNDTVGHELRDEIMAYARAQGCKARFKAEIGAWHAPVRAFPPRLRKIAGFGK